MKEEFSESLKDHERRIRRLEDEVIRGNYTASKTKNNIRSFVEKLSPSTHEERALYIAYYLEHYEDLGGFSRADIEEGYHKCKAKLYSNIPMLIKRLYDKRGWIMQAKEGEGSLWVLTADGESFVENKLSGENGKES